MKTGGTHTELELLREMRRVRHLILRFNKTAHLVFLNRPLKVLGFQFLAGIVRGVGSAIGVMILLGGLVYILTFFEFFEHFMRNVFGI